MNSTLTLLLLFLAFSLFAQTQTTVHGNLGVENVNISIVNTPYGTSTDAKGHYDLPLYDRTKTVNLYYSCIGYQDTVVSLMPRQLQRDSLNISFKMRKMSYDLQEVGVSAYQDFYRSKTNRNIADIAFLDGKIYLLENKPTRTSTNSLKSSTLTLSTTSFSLGRIVACRCIWMKNKAFNLFPPSHATTIVINCLKSCASITGLTSSGRLCTTVASIGSNSTTAKAKTSCM